MKIQFTVSTDNILAFAEVLSEGEIKNEIIGKTEDDCLMIDVFCSSEDKELIEELDELAESDE